jgi:glycerol-3-phosphate dehydrogenase (NAD(P)+)
MLRGTQLCIIGRGHWGSALGSLLQPNFSVSFLEKNDSPRIWKKSLENSPLTLIATPFSALPEILLRLRSAEIAGVINASKGIDRKSLLTFSGLAKKYLRVPFATLSGPTFAQEVAEKKPTACVLAGKNQKFLANVARLASSRSFRIYMSSDPVGVEVCGATKNVLAIACGISDGLRLGLNARAALLTRGLNEMRILVELFGGRKESVFGLAGVGDLWLTATGDLSRNRQFGLNIAKGSSRDEALASLKGPCEGLYTVRQVHELAHKHKLELPISEQVYRICFEKQNPKKALLELMTRELKAEDSNLSQAR